MLHIHCSLVWCGVRLCVAIGTGQANTAVSVRYCRLTLLQNTYRPTERHSPSQPCGGSVVAPLQQSRPHAVPTPLSLTPQTPLQHPYARPRRHRCNTPVPDPAVTVATPLSEASQTAFRSLHPKIRGVLF